MSRELHDAAAGRFDGRPRAVQRAQPGEHLCSFHDTQADRGRLATAFVASGLWAGDRVIYVADQREPEAVRYVLRQGGVPAEAALRSGQLLLLEFASVYGPAEDDGMEAVAARYVSEVDRSHADGYPGLRVAVELGDRPSPIASVDRLAEWEDQVDDLFRKAGVLSLCLYDQRLAGTEARTRVAAEHEAVATDDGTVPPARFSATETPWGVEVAGELDLATAPALARVLRARARVDREVHVDLGAVTFADLVALRTVFEVAGDLPSDSVLVLGRTPPGMRRMLDLLQWHDPRVQAQLR